jgi:hypothetical protein
MRRAIVCCLLLSLLAAATPPIAHGGTVTWSFGAGDAATCPKSISFSGSKIVVDLAALPNEAKPFRAVLRCQRERIPGRGRESEAALVVAVGDEKPLPLLPPRFSSFDATAPVVQAVAGGARRVEFAVKSLPGWRRDTTRLDVWFTGGKPAHPIPPATGLAARHRSGQTILTWNEADPATTAPEMTVQERRELNKHLAAGSKQTAYRIYRHTEPLTDRTLQKAQLVDEVGPLTCWNAESHGIYPDAKDKVFRYVVDAQPGGTEPAAAAPVAPGTGIYAHNPAQAGRAYYVVSTAVNGEEDLDALVQVATGRHTATVEETVGPGEPILQRIEQPKEFLYMQGVTLYFYTRWESPPRCNLPSRPYDYNVILGPKLVQPAPLNLILHCWGSNLRGKGGAFSWFGWKDKALGIGVASNQIPYDWWTTYHENLGTWKCWNEGVTRDFTAKRLFAFVEWVGTKWQVDQTRVCVSGESMGGSGSTFLPIRYANRFAYAFSSVGIHNPAAIRPSGFYESYANHNGEFDARLKHESGLPAWDYLNDPLLVRKNPAARLPFIGFGNGKNDGGIGWPHVVDLAKALQEARQPHAVVWRMAGHGSGTFYPRDIDFRLDQSLPAFTNCSLDAHIGTAIKLPTPKQFTTREKEVVKDIWDGDSEGQINMFLRWATADIVDEPGKWECTIMLEPGAPKDECTVDVTPRRLQKLRVPPGQKFTWTARPAKNGQAQDGTAVADKDGLVTLKTVAVGKGGTRLSLLSGH